MPANCSMICFNQIMVAFCVIWLQNLPKKFCNDHLPNEDTMIVLEDESGREFQTKYLVGKAGLSAGWRGFAISHKLLTGDIVVFQRVTHSKFKVHIVRSNGLDAANCALSLVNLDGGIVQKDTANACFGSIRNRKKNTSTNRDENLEVNKFEADPQVLYFNGEPFGSGKQTELSLRGNELKASKTERPGRFSKFLHRSSSCPQKSNFSLDLTMNSGVGEEEDEIEEEVVVRGTEIVIMNRVFEAVMAMKNAYVSLQETHDRWDPEKLRAADVAVMGELRRLAGLRERYLKRRSYSGGDMLREVLAPYEAAVKELRREVKARDIEVEQLKEKLKSIVSVTNNGTKMKSLSKRKIYCSSVIEPPAIALFEASLSLVMEASQSFTWILLSLMLAAKWDIAAAVLSIEAAASTATTISTSSIINTEHANAKYALQSYISRKIFLGFDHESFYMDGSISSLLNPEKYRQNCSAQYGEMKSIDPIELLEILPGCNFGKFCSYKYLAIVHPRTEESLFGDLEQRRQVVEGSHPRSQFYKQFVELAKAVWLLHLLAFSLDPAPSQFEASRGAEFRPQYMESVVKFPGGIVPPGQVVGFPMNPGFKLENGSIIKAGVYLVPKN